MKKFVPPFPIVQPNHTYFSQKHNTRMQTGNATVATNNFYFILNTNQIKLNTYPDLLKESNLKGYS